MFALTKKLVLSSVAGVGLLMSLTAAAHAAQETFNYSGLNCQPQLPADAAKLTFNAFGALNMSSSTATVVCAMPTRPNQFVASVSIQGFDRNSSGGLNCELDYMDPAGNAFISQQNRGTTAALNQQPPTSFFFSVTPSQANGMTMTCTIPAATAQGVSGITQMRVTTNL
jgi:hypothetical protein